MRKQLNPGSFSLPSLEPGYEAITILIIMTVLNIDLIISVSHAHCMKDIIIITILTSCHVARSHSSNTLNSTVMSTT